MTDGASERDHAAAERSDNEQAPDPSRRSFVQGSLMGAVALGSLGAAARAQAQAASPGPSKTTVSHHYVPANADTVHWGYFSKKLKPVIEVQSGDYVTLETVTHHA